MELFQDPVHKPFFFDNGRSVGALLIHGFPGTPAETRHLGEALSQVGITARGILLPGFGPEITELKDKSRLHWIDAAATAWKEMQGAYDQTILLGYSMGGGIATILAAEIPPDQLILMAPFWRFPSWIANYFMPLVRYVRKEISPIDMGGDLDDPGFQEDLKRFIPDLDFDDEETRRTIKEDFALPTTILEEVWRLGREAYKLSKQVDAAALVMQGTQDKIVLPRHTHHLVKRLRRKSDVTFNEIVGTHQFVKSDGPYLDVVQKYVRSINNKSEAV